MEGMKFAQILDDKKDSDANAKKLFAPPKKS